MADSQTLLSICDRVHIVLTRKDTLGEVHLVSSHFLEWRQVLCAQANKTNRTLELNGIGAENKLPVGLINVCLQLIPPLNETISDDILAAQLDLEHSKSTERERLFLIYAKQWWKEYLEIREEHRTRLVKIFGQVKTKKKSENEFHRNFLLFKRMKMVLIILYSHLFNHFVQVVYLIHHVKPLDLLV